MLKECTGCKVEKPVDDFNIDRRSPAGALMSRCKSCRREEAKAWRKKNANYERNRYLGNEQYHREKHLRKKYNISQVDYDALFKSQDGKCAICSRSQKRVFDVDHCHKTGAVRGLLCSNCNRTIGYAHDNIHVLLNAAKYLRKSRLKYSKQ